MKTYYQGASVVLAGNTGVGKSGLASVLRESDPGFTTTDSTHGRQVQRLVHQLVQDGDQVLREVWLWDLAGQPIYRLVHHLYLGEVTLGVVVFDSGSETDPLAGIQTWTQFLRAQERLHPERPPMRKILVAARCDQPGQRSSSQRIQEDIRAFGFDRYIETSAKMGLGIPALREAIAELVVWDELPRREVPPFFARFSSFALGWPESGQEVAQAEGLCRAFLAPISPDRTHRAQVSRALEVLEAAGLVRRLSTDGLVLLASASLDAYAAALVNHVWHDEQGRIWLRRALAGGFHLPDEVRRLEPDQERVLLQVMVEDLLRNDVALLQQDEGDVPSLVFPALGLRTLPTAPAEGDPVVVYSFEGALLYTFSSLAVRLARSGRFRLKGVWGGPSATFGTHDGGTCGLLMRTREEGRAELTLFFSPDVGEEARRAFDGLVAAHLGRVTLPQRLTRRSTLICPSCGTPFLDFHVQKRLARGGNDIKCGVCDTAVLLSGGPDPLVELPAAEVAQWERAADSARVREVAAVVTGGGGGF